MVSFVGAAQAGGNVAALLAANSTAVTWPAGVQNLDIALLPWTFGPAGTTATDPTSETWTLWDQVTDGNDIQRFLYRICDGSESGDITGWSCSATNRQSAVLSIYRGFSSIAAVVSFQETVTGTTHDCPTIGTGDGAADGDVIVVIATDRAASTGCTAPTTPITFTERANGKAIASGSGGTITAVADDGLTGQTMPFNPGAWTGFVSSGTAVTRTVALRPSATNATKTPASTTTVVSVPQAVPSAGSAQAPAATAATVGTPQATASAGSSQAPSATAAAVALPQATITGNAVVSPGTISAVVTAPSSGLNVGAGSSAVSAVVAAPQAVPAVAGNATATPAQIVGVVSVPAAVPSGGAVRTPAVLVTTVSAPQATPAVGTSATATPSATSVAVTFPQALRSAGATVTPARIQTAVSAPTASPVVGTTASPSVITSVVAFLQGLIHAGASPGATQVTVALPHATGPVTEYVTPTKVVTTVRDYSSVATARDLQPSAVGRSSESTAIARSPE